MCCCGLLVSVYILNWIDYFGASGDGIWVPFLLVKCSCHELCLALGQHLQTEKFLWLPCVIMKVKRWMEDATLGLRCFVVQCVSSWDFHRLGSIQRLSWVPSHEAAISQHCVSRLRFKFSSQPFLQIISLHQLTISYASAFHSPPSPFLFLSLLLLFFPVLDGTQALVQSLCVRYVPYQWSAPRLTLPKF